MSLQALIEEKLRAELEPSHLEVINESGMHNAPAGAESHFKVIVVSDKFEGRCECVFCRCHCGRSVVGCLRVVDNVVFT